jgi:ferric-dicitrate binding protein FerR (iron transport regulator)
VKEKVENIDKLIIASLKNEITGEEIVQLNAWRKSDVSNAQLYNQYKDLWDKGESIHLFFQVENFKDWEKVKDRLNASRKSSPHKVKTTVLFTLRKIAAVFILALLVATSLLLYYYVPGFGYLASIKTQKLAKESVLPDQSEVLLNKNSKLIYHRAIGANDVRMVSLDGEALFKVQRNNSPFIVSVGIIEVEVLGTVFNVKEDDNTVYVTVVEGKVKVTAGEKSVLLTKEEKGVFKDGKLLEERVETLNDLYWCTKELKFKRATLKEICEQLKDAFPEIKKVKYNSSNFPTKVTTTFTNQSLNDIIEELKIHFNKKIVLDGNILIISD